MNIKKISALMLAGAMAFSLAACGGGSDTSEGNLSTSEGGEKDHYTVSKEIYDATLGDFYEAYQEADSTDNTVAERYAKFAIAEAKLLESGIILPTTTQYGDYALGRGVYNSSDYALWGNDNVRYYNMVVTTEMITNDDYTALKKMWEELKGTGTYRDEAISYLKGKGYEIKDTLTYAYHDDPSTWDGLVSYLESDSNAIVNTCDGLLEYDCEGEQQPALAESYEVSDDGLTYTFHLREGVKWVDSQGREVGELTADDFVAGLQHLLDAKGGLEYLATDVIVNAEEYCNSEISDFSEVGVKAVDDHTLQYTLKNEAYYFPMMLGYSTYLPMCRSYYESCGGKFGAEYDDSASDYTYASDPDHIAYCGAYLVTNFTAANKIVFTLNESYWNKDAVQNKKITWMYDDGSDSTKVYNDVVSGDLDTGNMNTSSIELAKGDGNFEKYAHVRDTDMTTFANQYNLNREAFANFNDSTKAVSTETDEDAARTNAAMNNQNFRLAISFALDRTSYNAQTVGEDLAALNLRNSYTPAKLVSLPEEATISINGTEKTFPEGTYFGEIVQAQLDADGIPIKAWDADADDGMGSGDGYDGWYNPENAMEYLEKAIEELKEDGVEISSDNPIQLDIPYPANSEEYTNRNSVYKQSLETVLEGNVQVNMVACTDYDEWYYTGYYIETADQANFDICDVTGWTPDFGDPENFLSTYLPDGDGYQTKNHGLF